MTTEQNKESVDSGRLKNVFIAWTNTDLTEGRGYLVPIAICETRATALRLAKNAGVMGSNGDVSTFPAILHAGNWCAPFKMVAATNEDKQNQIFEDARQDALFKAKEAGLSDEDIRALIGIKP